VAGRRIDWKLVIGLAISALCLWLLLGKMDLAKLVAAFRTMETSYLWPAVALTFASYFFRAVRWFFLLIPSKRVAMWPLLSATLIGYMANNILPARLGEFVRAYALARHENLRFGQVFATLVLDRLFDGFTVLLILVVTFFSVRLPAGMEKVQQGLVTGGYVTLALYTCCIAFILLLRWQTAMTLKAVGFLLRPLPDHLGEKITGTLASFIAGLRLPSRPVDLAALFVSSLVIWALATWPIDLVLKAFGIDLPLTASMFIIVFLVFAVMVPAAPGFIGTFHAACVYGLMAFRVPLEQAMSVALVIHGINFFPVIIAGFLCAWRDKLSLSAMRATTSEQEQLP
jgi:uncharacterized protein (TIRG00374 family)